MKRLLNAGLMTLVIPTVAMAEQPAPPTEPAAPPIVEPAITPWVDQQPAAPVDPKPAIEITAKAGKGITFKTDSFSLNLRARGQVRSSVHAAQPDDGDRAFDETTQVGGLRLWLSGHTITPKLLYNIQLGLADRDYRDGTISPILDTFIEYKAHRDLTIKAGQFFVPFDRLRTVREFALQMTDRPRPVNELTLDRDTGVILYSDTFLGDASPLAWRVGVFGGNGINKSAAGEVGYMPVARLELRPLGKIDDDVEGDQERRKKPGLALGVGGAVNFHTNRVRSTNGGTFQTGTTSYRHLAADAVFKWLGVAVQLEYLWRGASKKQFSAEVDGETVTDVARQGSGWVAQASYTFDHSPGFELVGRLSRLYAPEQTDPKYATEVDNLGNEYALGANYYFNGHQFKLQADWIGRTGEARPTFDHTFVVQLDATF